MCSQQPILGDYNDSGRTKVEVENETAHAKSEKQGANPAREGPPDRRWPGTGWCR